MSQLVVDRLQRLFTEVLQIDAPGATVDLVDGGYLDSLALVELLAATELEFDIDVPLDELDLGRVRTIERLAELVAERQAFRSTAA